MRLAYWHVLLFIVAVIAVTIAVFPSRETLVPYYAQAGKESIARELLDELIRKNPNDAKLRLMSAEAYQAEGLPDKSIADLLKAIEIAPRLPELRVKLAEYYELNRQPELAVSAWEEVLKLQADHPKALNRLADLYNYYGETGREAVMAVRLVRKSGETGRKAFKRSLMAEMIADQILSLAGRYGSFEDDQSRVQTINGLYNEWRDYVETVEDEGENRKRKENTVQSCVEFLVTGNFIEEAKRFAYEADRKLKTGNAGRMKLAESLRWGGEAKKALNVLDELAASDPQNADVWRHVAEVAEEQKLEAKAKSAYEKLAVLLPKDTYVKNKLAEVNLAAGNVTSAFNIYMELEDPLRSGDIHKLKAALMRLIEASEATGKARVIEDAAAIAAGRLPDDPDLLERAGRAHLAAGRYDAAYAAFKAVAVQRRDVASVEGMMQAAAGSNKPVQLDEASALARKLRPGDVAILLKAADMMLAGNRLPGAIGLYEDYLRRNSGDRQAVRRLAELYEWNNEPLKAFRILKALADKSPADRGLMIKVAKLAEASGNDREAFRIYARVRQLFPDDKAVRADVARLASWTNQPRLAAGIYAEIADDDPASYDKALKAGKAFADASQSKKAVVYTERAVRLRPDVLEPRRNIARYYGWAGDRKKQIAALEYLEKRSVMTAEEKTLLAEAHVAQRNGRQAVRLLQGLERGEKLPPREGMLLVHAYSMTGNDAMALKTINRLAGENSRNAGFLSEIGNAALGVKQMDAALKLYEAALRIDPKNTAALKGSAQFFAGNNNAARAINRFEDHNRLKGNDIEARYQLGELYFGNERKGQAYGEYRKTLELIRKARAKEGRKSSAGGKMEKEKE